MNYQLKAYPIHELGKREGQEDSIFPAKGKATAADRLFMVCDGMGGHEAGEVASAAVIEAMSRYILAHTQPDGDFPDEVLTEALSQAYDLLDERDPHPDSLKKMGTTMTLLKFHARGITIAHIGDSRVYQFRPTANGVKVVFKTEDHSLVNDLLRIGELTPEEAVNYPRKNVITRAMQSHLDYRPKADIYHSADVQPGDYFYLCSDGMLENATDDNLCNILKMEGKSDEDKVKILIQNSEENKDNHSAYLIHVLGVTNGHAAPAASPSGNIPSASPSASSRPSVSTGTDSTPAHRINFNYVLIGAVAVLAVAIWFFTRPSKTDAPKPEQTENVWNSMNPTRQQGQKQKPQKPSAGKPSTKPSDKKAPKQEADKKTEGKKTNETPDKKPENQKTEEKEKTDDATEKPQSQNRTLKEMLAPMTTPNKKVKTDDAGKPENGDKTESSKPKDDKPKPNSDQSTDKSKDHETSGAETV